MKSMSAKEAKNAFGLLMDTARAEPVMIVKHGRPVAVVVSIEQFELLNGRKAAQSKVATATKKAKYVNR